MFIREEEIVPRRCEESACPWTPPTPAAGKLAQTARPTDAERTAGLWTPAACRYGLHLQQRSVIHGGVCGGLRRQASRAKRGFEGAEPPAFFCRRYYAREPRAAAKATGRSPWGDQKAQRGEFKTNVRVAHTLLVDPK